MKIIGAIGRNYQKNTALGAAIRAFARIYFGISRVAHRLLGKTDFSSERIFASSFLDGEIYTENLKIALDKSRRIEKFPKKLLQILKKNYAKKKKPLKVLDLGSGPLSALAYGQDAGIACVVAVDPLADFYIKKIREKNIAYPVLPIGGTGENLLDAVKKEEFDICYSSNAIDHADSPRRCIENMVAACKINGLIYLRGGEREGTRTGWVGLHRHDIVLEGGGLVDYEQNGKMTELTRGLGLEMVFKNIEKREGHPNHPHYTLVLRRGQLGIPPGRKSRQ